MVRVEFLTMSIESRLGRIALVALLAVIRFGSSVSTHMYVEIAFGGELPMADVAHKRLLSGMRSNMTAQCVLLLEGAWTERTIHDSQFRVHPDMLLQV